MKINSLLEFETASSSPLNTSPSAPKFGRSDKFLEEKDKEETVEECTTSGSVASVATPVGSVQRRGKGDIFAGISTSEKYPNSKAVKETTEEEVTDEGFLGFGSSSKPQQKPKKPLDYSAVRQMSQAQKPTSQYYHPDEYVKKYGAFAEEDELDENSMADFFAKAAQEKFPTATIRKNGETIQQAPQRPQPKQPPVDVQKLEQQLADLQQKYEQLGGDSWQYADKMMPRDIEAAKVYTAMISLGRQISNAKKNVDEGEEMSTFAALKDWRVWDVHVYNNYYRGKYADYGPRLYSVVASSPEEARQVVINNPDYVLQDLLSRKLVSGKRVLPRGSALPIEAKRVGKAEPGTITTMAFKKMLTPDGVQSFKFTNGKIVDGAYVQGGEEVEEGMSENRGYFDDMPTSDNDYFRVPGPDAKPATPQYSSEPSTSDEQFYRVRYTNEAGQKEITGLVTHIDALRLAKKLYRKGATQVLLIPSNKGLGIEEGLGGDMAKLIGIPVVAGAAAIGAQHYDDQQPHVQVGGQNAKIVQYGSSRIPDSAMLLKGQDGKMYRVWQQSGKGMNKITLASPAEPVKEGLNKTPLAQATVTALQAVLKTHPEWVEQYGAREVKRVTKYVTRGFWEAMNQDDVKGIVQNVGWELIASAEENLDEQGVAEGTGNFAKAIDNLHGWYQVNSNKPELEIYEFDDREGGFYADGTVYHNTKTGRVKIEFQDKMGEYGGINVDETFNSIGDAMNVLRQITIQIRPNSGKAQNFDRLGGRELAGPDDVYKTDRAGKKGTLTKSRMDTMKMSSPYRKTGPKGILPEQGVAEDQLDEKSVSKAQFRTMAAVAHNPKFAKKVGISQKVGKEFHKADKKSDYEDLPARADEEKQRLDPKCWTGYKKQGTKMKGGVRVNNCVKVDEVSQELAVKTLGTRRAYGMDGWGNDEQHEKADRTEKRVLKKFGQSAIDAANKETDKQLYGDYRDVKEGEIAEDKLAQDLYKDLQIFKKGIDKDIGSKAKDKEIGQKPKDKDIIAKEAANAAQQAAIAIAMKKKGQKPQNENAEYDDEAGSTESNLLTTARAVKGLLDTIGDRDNLPEWVQEKIAKAEGMLVASWDYLQSQKEQGVDPQVDEDWQKVNKKDKTDGMSPKAVKAYRRENPGSKLQTAVTKKPSELKAGSKDAKRRKSFCARMSGVEGPMKDEKGRPTPKAKALKRWNC